MYFLFDCVIYILRTGPLRDKHDEGVIQTSVERHPRRLGKNARIQQS